MKLYRPNCHSLIILAQWNVITSHLIVKPYIYILSNKSILGDLYNLHHIDLIMLIA